MKVEDLARIESCQLPRLVSVNLGIWFFSAESTRVQNVRTTIECRPYDTARSSFCARTQGHCNQHGTGEGILG
jgi:hypothetical protein